MIVVPVFGFVHVTVCGTTPLVGVQDGGLMVLLPPMPERVTGKLPAEVAMVSVADREPVAVGSNLVETAHVPPFAATTNPFVQVLAVLGKSAVFPVVVTDEIVMLAAVPFVNIAVCGEVELPTKELPKFSLDGATLTLGGRGTTSGCGQTYGT